MVDRNERMHRNTLLFGADGQTKLSATKVVIGGVSGLGSPLALHLALLGVQQIAHFDPEELDQSNRNRFVGARESDPVPGSAKVALVDRLIKETNASVRSIPLKADLLTAVAFDAVKEADWAFGCFDHDGPRAVLNELCAAYRKPYIDLASDVPAPGEYGGRILVSQGGAGCLHCLGELDQTEIRRFLMSSEERAEHDRIYGIDRAALNVKGPSVAPLNGVVAALAAMEFMVAVTGLRAPKLLQTYRGELPALRLAKDAPSPACPVCKSTWGLGAAADVERFLRLRSTERYS